MFLSRFVLLSVLLLSGCSNVLDLSGEIFNGTQGQDVDQMVEDTSPDPDDTPDPDPFEDVMDPPDIPENDAPDAAVEDAPSMDLDSPEDVPDEPDVVEPPETPARLCRIDDWKQIIPRSEDYNLLRLDDRQILPTAALSDDGTRIMIAWQDTSIGGAVPKRGSLGWVILDAQGEEVDSGEEDSPARTFTSQPKLSSDDGGFVLFMLGGDSEIDGGRVYYNRYSVEGAPVFDILDQPVLYGLGTDNIDFHALDATSRDDLSLAAWNQTVGELDGVGDCGEDGGEAGCIKMARLVGQDVRSFKVADLSEPCSKAGVSVALAETGGQGLVAWGDCESGRVRWRILDGNTMPSLGLGSVESTEGEDSEPAPSLLALGDRYILTYTNGEPLNVFTITIDNQGALIEGPLRVEDDEQDQRDPRLLNAAGAPTVIYVEGDDLELSRFIDGGWTDSPDPLDDMDMDIGGERPFAALALPDGRVLIVASVHINNESNEDLMMAFFEGCSE